MSMSKYAAVLAMVLCGIGGISIAAAEHVTITRTVGSVKILVAGSAVNVRGDERLDTPLRIETGNDGSLHIEHASWALDIGPNSIVAVPGNAPASTMERIRQEIGRVLYSVKPRKSKPLAVETPYLVSVVKGTTFSVAVESASTTVALLEGSLEVSAPELDEPVLLKPNQRARRAEGESSISVNTIDTSAPPPPGAGAAPLPIAQSNSDLPHALADSAVNDLNEIAAVRADRTTSPPEGTLPPPAEPDLPSAPGPTPGPDPVPPEPPSPPPVDPEPEPDPTPLPPDPGDDDDDDDDDDGDDDDDDDDDD